MNSDAMENTLEELLKRAKALPDGPAKLALLEEAVRRADAQQKLKVGFRLRKELIRIATFTGAQEKAIVAFTWRLAQCDRHPEQFSEEDLLWEYKWIVNGTTDFPQISLQQIADMLADIERRYQRSGRGMRAIYKLRSQMARSMGQVEEARQAHRLWRDTPIGKGNDCTACECNGQVEYLLFVGEEEQALELAEPIVKGQMKCTSIPHETYPILLLPLARCGRLDEAMQYHVLGYRMVAGNAGFLSAVARHLRFVTLTLNLGRAVQLFEKHLPWAVETLNSRDQFEFYQSTRFLLDVMRETRHDTIAARLPNTMPIAHEERSYKVEELAAFFDAQCRDLAARFDARNGNDYFARRLDEPRQWKQLITPFPLPQP